jgi:uncharacterized C2H2 Zn-finger protein
MVDDLEVYCPDCGKLFKGQNRMLRHVETDHVGKKKHAKEVMIELDARYLGGHPSFTHPTNGLLSLYSHPLDKVIFESDDFIFEIPTYAINRVKVAEGKEIDAMRVLLVGLVAGLVWQKKNKIFYIEFQDELHQTHTAVFDHSDAIDEFADKLNATIPTNREAINYENNKEQNPISQTIEDPLHIIKIRYAKGEITKEQYEEMKRTLTS